MNKSDLLLLLLWSDNTASIHGKTRLVKLMYIIDKKLELVNLKTNYTFRRHYYGPYSNELIEDLEKLIQKRLVDRQITWKGQVIEHVYSITQEGRKKVDEMIKQNEIKPYLKVIEDVKKEYGNLPLFTLVDEVYRKYLSS